MAVPSARIHRNHMGPRKLLTRSETIELLVCLALAGLFVLLSWPR